MARSDLDYRWLVRPIKSWVHDDQR
jgi:hypothetical protein